MNRFHHSHSGLNKMQDFTRNAFFRLGVDPRRVRAACERKREGWIEKMRDLGHKRLLHREWTAKMFHVKKHVCVPFAGK
jgi:hypothetical protein